MSYDRQIDQLCEHRVVEEALFVDYDRQTIRPLRPIASTTSILVRMDGDFMVPSFGVYAPARVVSGRQEPFTIKAGMNDLILLQVGDDPVQSLRIAAGVGFTALRLSELLNLQAKGVLFEAHGLRLSMRTVLEGRGATAVFQPGSTMAATLGLGINRVWRGRVLAPGWTLVANPNTLSDRQTRWIVFDDKVKSASNFVEITYTTVQQECRRCGGLGVEDDWRYTGTGDVVEVRDEALLLQEVMKLMYTIQGSNPFNPWYGTGLINMIGSKVSMGDIIRNSIISDVQQAFTRWQSIKRQQELSVGQYVSDREYPFRLLSIDVQQSQQDPTIFFIFMTVQNRSGYPVDMQRGIRIPQPTALLSSTAAQGVLRQSLSNFVLTG